MTAVPIRVKIMALAQIWCQITPALAGWVSMAIIVKTLLTTAEQPTAAKMASVSTLVQSSTAAVEVDTLGNTASLKLMNVWLDLVSTTQLAMIWSTILLALALTGIQADYVRAILTTA